MILRPFLCFFFACFLMAAGCSTTGGNKAANQSPLNSAEKDTLAALAKVCSNPPEEISTMSQGAVERIEKGGTKITREAFMKRALSMIEGLSVNDKSRLDEQGKIDFTIIAATIVQSISPPSTPATNTPAVQHGNAPRRSDRDTNSNNRAATTSSNP